MTLQGIFWKGDGQLVNKCHTCKVIYTLRKVTKVDFEIYSIHIIHNWLVSYYFLVFFI